MEQEICKFCTHYVQHYALTKSLCITVECGHCTWPRMKGRKPGTKACGHFELRQEPLSLPERERVIRFLTVDVLQRILSLELPYGVPGE